MLLKQTWVKWILALIVISVYILTIPDLVRTLNSMAVQHILLQFSFASGILREAAVTITEFLVFGILVYPDKKFDRPLFLGTGILVISLVSIVFALNQIFPLASSWLALKSMGLIQIGLFLVFLSLILKTIQHKKDKKREDANPDRQ